MTTPAYDVGDLRRFQVSFTDVDDAPVDPTSVTVRLREPDGTLMSFVYGTDPEVVRTALGAYEIDLALTQAGRHVLRWEGTGAGQAAEETEFHVRAPHASP